MTIGMEYMSLNVSLTHFFETQPVLPHDHTFDGVVVHLDSDCDRHAPLYMEKVHQKQRTLQHIAT